MSQSDELVFFHEWAVRMDLMYRLEYGADGLWEVEIISAAESECYSRKKIESLKLFVKEWESRQP